MIRAAMMHRYAVVDLCDGAPSTMLYAGRETSHETLRDVLDAVGRLPDGVVVLFEGPAAEVAAREASGFARFLARPCVPVTTQGVYLSTAGRGPS